MCASVSTCFACAAVDCAIGTEYPQVKQPETITQVDATPAATSRRSISAVLSIERTSAMFQNLALGTRNLLAGSQLRLTVNEFRGARRIYQTSLVAAAARVLNVVRYSFLEKTSCDTIVHVEHDLPILLWSSSGPLQLDRDRR